MLSLILFAQSAEFRTYATRTYTAEIRTFQDSELLAGELMKVAGRSGPSEFLWGRTIELDVTIDPTVADWVPPPRMDGKPPSLRLESSLCPNSLGQRTYFRVFFYGDDFGPDNFGLAGDRGSVALRGTYEPSRLHERDLNGQEYCFLDLREKE